MCVAPPVATHELVAVSQPWEPSSHALIVGKCVGAVVGTLVGTAVGGAVGASVGIYEGAAVGATVDTQLLADSGFAVKPSLHSQLITPRLSAQ